jgi:H+-transporting ATPase
MVTGDAPATAGVVAGAVGITGPIHPPGRIRADLPADRYGVFAGVLPEDKFNLIKAFQQAGHTVGMCGDGANDAPALRQAQIGIAVSTATDVAKSAAGVVLTEPGLAGIVAAVREGRITFQRILTYTLRSLVNKVRQVLFLGLGLAMTGHAVLTPMLMVMAMITGDFLAMSATTDNVAPSPQPNRWRIGSLTAAGVVLGLCDLAFCAVVLAVGTYRLELSIDSLQTLTLVTLVFNGQAIYYAVRERRRIWSSKPSPIVILASAADVLIVPSFAATGFLMTALPLRIIAGVFASAVVLAFVMDAAKAAIFRALRMT